jgi:GPH family glycoside/pentoside/hexuronide:cation symporter
MSHRLPAYSVFAAMLAAAGLPIYIHAPKFYVDEYGLSLATLGAILFALRMLDVVQDPVLGWVSSRLKSKRGLGVAIGVAVMAVSMYGLFAVRPPVAAGWWFAICLTGLFSGFSFLTINFYAEGVNKADTLGPKGHLRLAGWRETGALLGVCVASVAPAVFAGFSSTPFSLFALGFGGLCIFAWLLMRREWVDVAVDTPSGFSVILADAKARRLLLLALINATPVAVTSTLFLFFVESRLGAPGMEGPLLLLFFLSAAVTAPLWGRLAQNIGVKKSLLWAMAMAIATFAFAATLQTGDTIFFAIICITSGAALAADMTLLSAIFANHMARIAPNAAQAFGLWSFVSKFTLAFAAVALLPVLEATGFQSGLTNTESSLWMLTVLYALVPCALKLIAVALLAATDLEEIPQ